MSQAEADVQLLGEERDDEDGAEEKLERLQTLMDGLSSYQSELAQLRMSASLQMTSNSQQVALDDISKRWHALHTQVSARFRQLQRRQRGGDINGRLEEWRAYMANIERDLTANVANTHNGLLEQQRSLEVLVNIVLVFS